MIIANDQHLKEIQISKYHLTIMNWPNNLPPSSLAPPSRRGSAQCGREKTYMLHTIICQMLFDCRQGTTSSYVTRRIVTNVRTRHCLLYSSANRYHEQCIHKLTVDTSMGPVGTTALPLGLVHLNVRNC